MTKQEIRQAMRTKRDRYPSIHIDSVRIWDLLEHSKLYQKAQRIFTHCSFGSEVETVFTLEHMLRQGKEVYLPRLQERRQMEFHVLEYVKKLERNRFGVYEPPMWERIGTPDAKSLMLVPGVAFDVMGNRVGFGGGFYDSYLERFPNTLTMGMCFDFQFIEDRDMLIPTEATDRKMDYVLTPRGIYSIEEGSWI